MDLLGALQFGPGRRVPLFLQTEAAECGLACGPQPGEVFARVM